MSIVIDGRAVKAESGRMSGRYFLFHVARMQPAETLLYVDRGVAGFVPVELEDRIEVCEGMRFITASFPKPAMMRGRAA